MSALKAYWEAVGGLRPEQASRLPAVEWLLDSSSAGSVRRSGRTTLMALAFLRDACSHPGRWIPVFDHVWTRAQDDGRRMADLVHSLLRGEGLDFRKAPQPSIRIPQGWAHTVLDPVQGPAHVQRLEGCEAFPVLEGGAAPETLLEDLRSAVLAALRLGVPADAVLGEVRDAVVQSVMGE